MIESLVYSLIQSYNELEHGARYFISATLGLLILYACFLLFKIVLRQIKKFLTGELAAKILGTEVWAVSTVQPISTKHIAPATAMTENVVPPHIPQYWNDNTPHPWRRFCARLFDIMLSIFIAMILSIPVVYAMTLQIDYNSWMFITISSLLLVIINAVQIGLRGFSVGKWFCGVMVLNNEYKPMGFRLALKRELMVLYRGVGLNLPIISPIVTFIAYRRLRKNGVTTWDRDLHCIVLHKHMGFLQVFLRVFLCIIYFIAFSLLIYFMPALLL